MDPTEFWHWHNNLWRAGLCRERDHDKCSGDCQTCASRVITIAEIEVATPDLCFVTAFGERTFETGRDDHAEDQGSYREYADLLGVVPV